MSEKKFKKEELDSDNKITSSVLNNKFKKLISHNSSIPKYICECNKPLSFNVDVFIDNDNLYTKGFRKCRNSYICMDCRKKKLLKERKYISDIITFLKSMDYGAYFNTYIINHDKTKQLKDLIGNSKKRTGLLGAISIMKDSSEYKYSLSKNHKKSVKSRDNKSIKDKYKIIGGFRILEITYNINYGFSPHIHEILFTRNLLTQNDIESMENDLTKLYIKSLKKANTKTSKGRKSVVIKESDNLIAGYITKITNLSTDIEIKQDYKMEDIFSMLLMEYKGKIPKSMNVYELFEEYYNATRGKRLITWENAELEKHLKEVLNTNKSKGNYAISFNSHKFKEKYQEHNNILDTVKSLLHDNVLNYNSLDYSSEQYSKGLKQTFGYYTFPKLETDYDRLNELNAQILASDNSPNENQKDDPFEYDNKFDAFGFEIVPELTENQCREILLSSFLKLYPVIINRLAKKQSYKKHHHHFIGSKNKVKEYLSYHNNIISIEILIDDDYIIKHSMEYSLNLKEKDSIMNSLVFIDYLVFIKTALQHWTFHEIKTLTVNSITIDWTSKNLIELYSEFKNNFYSLIDNKI